MVNNVKKLSLLLFTLFVVVFLYVVPSYCLWGVTDKGGIYWVEPDGTLALDGWKLIYDNNTGVGYYYYFNKNGFILLDDITPDYKIVNAEGKRINIDGTVEAVKVDSIELDSDSDKSIYSAEILSQIKADTDVVSVQKGLVSSGEHIISKDPTEFSGPSPADGILKQDPNAPAQYILGPNVVLKNEKKSSAYDSTIDKNMQEHIKSGDKYSKKVNGTTFNKSKWKDVMALKGTGASIVFENPSRNFNKLKGRIATHYFSYTERTTQCTFTIYNEDDGEELFTTSDFNYNAGTSFECTFPKKTSAIRFELEVSGQYTSRVCYLRSCEFGFDKEAYEEELYEDEINAEYIRKVGTVSETTYEDEDENPNVPMGEVSLEGEDPGARYRRLNNVNEDIYWATYEYDESDDTITEAMKASISEARKKLDAQATEKDKISGPAFDPKLIDATEAIGPDGSTRFIEAHEGE